VRAREIGLTTYPSNKIVEWPIVFVVHCSEGHMPHSMSQSQEELDEELNMYYVAQTRAKNMLYMIHTHSKQDFTGTNNFNPSPFVMDNIPKIKEMKDIGKSAVLHIVDKSKITTLNDI